jgi:hypothetical protein
MQSTSLVSNILVLCSFFILAVTIVTTHTHTHLQYLFCNAADLPDDTTDKVAYLAKGARFCSIGVNAAISAQRTGRDDRFIDQGLRMHDLSEQEPGTVQIGDVLAVAYEVSPAWYLYPVHVCIHNS